MKVIITGASGMVGEGVLYECLQDARIESILVIGRRPCGHTAPKLKEILHQYFFDYSTIEPELTGYDACFFCLGISSFGLNEAEYNSITYVLTLTFAQTLARLNPEMAFCYVSGSGTDSSEKGRIMWARVKGKTENALFRLPFRRAYAIRPGFMLPTPGLKNVLSFYKYVNWLYPLMRTVFPNHASTLKQVALAMIQVAINGYKKPILEVKDLVQIAQTVKS